MPEVDLTKLVPPQARWIKVRFDMKPIKAGANLIARLWSGSLDDAVVIKGSEGEAFVRLDVPQKVWYQRPVGVDLKLKIVAYKVVEG
ncbi:MAG: hypothetical protein KCHDKBKB_02845 [Elusimicrobia bacterium]|nr:hypothetical protein [Elusimicrobiota bacterium]